MSKIFYLQNEVKTNNQNDYNAYFTELFDLLGCQAAVCKADELPRGDDAQGCVVFVGEGDYTNVSAFIEGFVEQGGTLVAIHSLGLDSVCGIRRGGFFGEGNICAASEFALNGHFRFLETPYAPRNVANCRLPIISDIRYALPDEKTAMPARVLAMAEEYKIPAMFERTFGKGRAFYFTFSLLKTCWYKTQGKPVYFDTDADGCCRAGDSIIVDTSDSNKIPAVDMYLHCLENILWEAGDHPLLHQIPADKEGNPCDYVLHFAGDEDWCSQEIFDANGELAKRGIPYHVHLQQKGDSFTITKEDYEKAEAQGMELSIHFDFITNQTYTYDYEALKAQLDLYRAQFNDTPVVACPHCLCYIGFGETARWYEELGLLGTFHQIGKPTNLLDPNEMNDYGFAFGTTYPTRSLDDWQHGNKRFGVVNIKIGFYEPRVMCKEDETRLDGWLQMCNDFAFVGNVFIHPVYLAEHKATVLPAVDRIVMRAKEKRVRLMYTDELAKWWLARGNSRVTEIRDGEWEADMQDACVLKFAYEPVCYIDGIKTETYRKTIAGRDCWLVSVAKGKHTVRVEK